MSLILGMIGAITAAATMVVKSLAVVGLAVQGLKTIGNTLMNLGKALGLIRPETKVDELGDKALQAEETGIRPEKFSAYSDYLKVVEKYELDPEKSKVISEEDKIKKGMELVTGILLEKYNDFPMEELCVVLGQNTDFFTEAKVQEIGKLILENEESITDMMNFINGTEKDMDKNENIIQTLTAIEKVDDPGISDKEALKAVLNIRKQD